MSRQAAEFLPDDAVLEDAERWSDQEFCPLHRVRLGAGGDCGDCEMEAAS